MRRILHLEALPWYVTLVLVIAAGYATSYSAILTLLMLASILLAPVILVLGAIYQWRNRVLKRAEFPKLNWVLRVARRLFLFPLLVMIVTTVIVWVDSSDAGVRAGAEERWVQVFRVNSHGQYPEELGGAPAKPGPRSPIVPQGLSYNKGPYRYQFHYSRCGGLFSRDLSQPR